VPTSAKDLKDQTISIRLAGVDAPEMAHFGRPSQPGSKEAFDYLTALLAGRRVRAYMHKRDQYERAVATVYVRRAPLFLRTDVSLDLLKQGLANVYEGKSGAEFGGEEKEKQYRKMEERARTWRRGIWGRLGREKGKARESPGEYKKRMAREGGEAPPS
jgi:endonuclease YncB( thermonuclease family)